MDTSSREEERDFSWLLLVWPMHTGDEDREGVGCYAQAARITVFMPSSA